jgi:tetratricopeptide (TPR) repeat protein
VPILHLNQGSLLLARAALSEEGVVSPSSDAIASRFQASLRRDGADWRPYVGLARLADVDGYESRSLEYWRQALDRSPRGRLYAFWLGNALERSGSHSEAVRAWREAQAQRAFTLQGDMWRRTVGATEAEAALWSYEQALEVDPLWGPAEEGLKEVLPKVIVRYWSRGEYGSAIPLLERKAALSPAPTDFVRLGDYSEGSGREDQACQWYRQGLQLYPRDSALNRRLGELLLRQGELRPAEIYLRRAISLEPTQVDTYR